MKPIPRFPAALSALALAAASAPAATLVVTSLDDDGPGTLRAVVASAQDGDVVTFADSLRGGTMTIVHRSHADCGVPVSASISIVGPADRSIALDGGFDWSVDDNDQGSRILVCDDATKSLRCENLVFRNANGRDWGSQIANGGAVYCAGDATFLGCTFVSNRAASTTINGNQSACGGGAMKTEGNLVVSNCTFVGNCAPTPPSWGGCIYAAGPSATIRDCSFDHDWSESYTGGIHLPATVRNATIEDCSFLDVRGGGNNCRGAAIYSLMASGSALHVERCVFRRCGFVAIGAFGGAIYAGGDGDVRLVDCEFSGCRGSSFGGAVRVEDGTAVLANCTFAGNAAAKHGGGFYLRNGSAWLVNCTFAGNALTDPSDHSQSGAIYHGGRPLSLLNTVAVHNYWTKDSSGTAEQKNVANSIAAATLAANASLADGSATDGETELFASYGTIAEATIHSGDDGVVAFAAPVPVPLLNEDARRSRVVEIAKGGPLDGKGHPVRHSADWSAIAFSTDGGGTWTAFRGSADDATILLDRDQRGVAYSLRRTPIGAAAFESPAETLLLLK